MIPVNEPVMPSRAREYVLECIDTGWISAQGRFVRLFEEAFARYLGVNVNVKYFSYPYGKDLSQERGKDISHPCGKQISHPPSE